MGVIRLEGPTLFIPSPLRKLLHNPLSLGERVGVRVRMRVTASLNRTAHSGRPADDTQPLTLNSPPPLTLSLSKGGCSPFSPRLQYRRRPPSLSPRCGCSPFSPRLQSSATRLLRIICCGCSPFSPRLQLPYAFPTLVGVAVAPHSPLGYNNWWSTWHTGFVAVAPHSPLGYNLRKSH